jgi:predicted nuclease of predicted toxin-antitoxin system
MRVLLDEHLDRRLKPLFDSRFEVVTVHEHGWTGKKNGVLLQAAQAEFDVLGTMDRSIEYQQNLQNLALAIVVLRAPSNRRQDTSPLIPTVNEVLAAIRPGEVIHVGTDV